jgi:hypothetical protein
MSDGPIPLAEATRRKLAETLGPVSFSDIKAHLGRDAVFVVAPSLELVECGVAVAMDEVETVRMWIETGALRKPSREERQRWLDQGGTFVAVVVQPFVLVQVDSTALA